MSASALLYVPSEHLGFDPHRLDRLTLAMQRQIDERKAPGVAMLIARHGKIAYRQALGALKPGGAAMTEDAIFRIYSMTKPIVSVAAMMLVEEGRLSVIDPVSAYIPAFADLKVAVPTADGVDFVPPVRPITVQDLLRHTSGLTYGFTGAAPVQKLTSEANVLTASRTTAENVEAIAALPLMHQPGVAWEYSVSTDVLGRIVEVVEGARLSDVLRARIFGPLDMIDTGFFTPQAKVVRRAEPFSFDIIIAAGADPVNVDTPPKFESGGGGLVSTLADYARFCAMLANGGAFQGARLLSPRTIAYMASDHLGATVNRNHYLLWPGHGFGLGFAVRVSQGMAPAIGSVGEYFWGGMMGTTFWISPRDDLFAVLMVQSPEHREYFRVLFRDLVYAALI